MPVDVDDRSQLTLTREEWALVANGVRDLIHVELDYEPADPLETWIGERARERQPEQP